MVSFPDFRAEFEFAGSAGQEGADPGDQGLFPLPVARQPVILYFVTKQNNLKWKFVYKYFWTELKTIFFCILSFNFKLYTTEVQYILKQL